MMKRWAAACTSIRTSVLFWWILFVVMQTAERVFLLRDALEQETPTWPLLTKTLIVGVRGDFITATFALVLAGIGAGAWALPRHGWRGLRQSSQLLARSFRRGFHVGCMLAGFLLFVLLCIDMGSYGFNRQYMDFVFLEYLGDLLAPAATRDGTNVQAMQQTGAELEASGIWAWRLAMFLVIQAVGMGLWWWSFFAAVVPAFDRWRPGSGFQANALLMVALVAGGAYDNLVGLASREGLLLYSFLTETFQEATLTFELMPQGESGQRRFSVARDRELMALYEVANVALDSNPLWPWREFGSRLRRMSDRSSS